MMNKHDIWAMEYHVLSRLTGEMAVLGPEAVSSNERPEPGEYTTEDGVAVIPVRGVLAVDPGYYARLYGYATAFADIKRMATEAAEDPMVRSILLDIDSPGGTVAGTKETAAVLHRVGKVKPLYAWTSDAMTSAAYWLGASSKKIGASETAQIGSIGVIATLAEYSKAAEKWGIKVNIVTTGEWKAAGHPYKPLTKDEKEYFQDRVDEIYSIFIRDVAEYRGVDVETALAMSGGARVYIAQAAMDAGLIDSIHESRDDFITKVKETNMDLNQLKAEHLDLYEAVKKEGREEAEAQMASDKAAAEIQVKDFRENVMAIVGKVTNEETAKKVEALIDSGIDAKQMAVLSDFFGKTEEVDGKEPKAGTLETMLAALQKATPGAVADGGDPKDAETTEDEKNKAKSKTLADIANR